MTDDTSIAVVRPSLPELLAVPVAERLARGREFARSLVPSWTAGNDLVGAVGTIELAHASGHAFVAVGATQFERGLGPTMHD
jgi:hypothetical protein